MNTEIWDIIARSLAGEATAEETAQLEAWKAAEPGNFAIWEEAKEAWNNTREVPVGFAPNVDAAWAKVSATLEETPVVPIDRGSGMSKRNRFIMRIAASAIILLAAAMIFKFLTADETVYDQMIVAKAEMQEATLPDGTQVWLNKNSTLWYPAAFDGSKRTVKLHGEAFFEVTKDAEHPFVITTTRTTTTVLGTSFNLRSYPSEELHELTVHTGKVSFIGVGADEELILEPGEMGKVLVTEDDEGGMLVQAWEIKAPSGNDDAWISGTLDFNNTPMEQVIIDLERQYGVVFETGNADLSDTITLPDVKSLKDVLSFVESQTALRFEIEGKTVKISCDGC